jgi:hypothetical protein
MSKLKSLQVKRLLKELDYIESELEYRHELVSEADNQFMIYISEFLEENPELKKLYTSRIDARVEQIINKKIEKSSVELDDNSSVSQEIEENSENQIIVPSKIKSLYREIVKLTHPDIIKRKNMNDIYINATKYYTLNDKVGIFKICDELNIDYDLDDEDVVEISDKINLTKEKLFFLESTLTWKWFNTDDDLQKKIIMVDYIKQRLFS